MCIRDRSSRWLVLGNLRLQPSELIKPFLILEASNLFAHWNLIKSDRKLISIISFGLLGCTLFLGFLAVFSYICLRISLKCRNNYTKLVAMGCGVLLTGQSIMHIAVATGSMPTTGLPLPFISYGGNSLIASFFIAGMLLRCSLESTGFIGMISIRKTLN